ncbi:MAG: aldo/keto reductase [Gammaproteobacteria bacterium]
MMEKNPLGSSDVLVSLIGLGTVKFGRNQGVRYPQHFELPTDEEISELLSAASYLGINLLDTAPAYGSSEERLGKLLKGKRKDWILCTKIGEDYLNGESRFDFSAVGVQQSIIRSLKRLGTDYLDIVLVHSNGQDAKIIEEDRVFDFLAALKQAGIIRAFGMSTKTIEGGMLAVDQSDVVMVTYNPTQPEEHPVIAYAAEQNKGILIKKALASGHLNKISTEDPVREAMNFIFQEPGVSSVIVGTLNKEHLEYNVRCAIEAKKILL